MNNMFQPYGYTRNGIIWVNGVEGAKAYQMMPSSNAVLLDSETDGRFYIKVADNVGMCSLRTFKYSEITAEENKSNSFVTHNELAQAIQELKGVLNEQLVQSAKSGNNE